MPSFWRRAFRKPESVDDYLGVWIPLDKAHNYSHSGKHGRTDLDEQDYVVDEDIEARLNEGDEDAALDDAGHETTKEENSEARGMLRTSAPEYSIEGLRAEMRKGRGGGPHGTWTSYESEFSRVLRAGQQVTTAP